MASTSLFIPAPTHPSQAKPRVTQAETKGCGGQVCLCHSLIGNRPPDGSSARIGASSRGGRDDGGGRAAVAGVLPEQAVPRTAVLPRLPQPVGRAAPVVGAGRRRRQHLARLHLRQRLQVAPLLPLRLLRRLHQAAARIHRRSHHRILPVQQRGAPGFPRRGGHGIPWDDAGAAVHAADQRVRPRHRRRRPRPGHRPGGQVPPQLVRPHSRLPPLRHPLEPHPHHILRGRRADPPLPSPERGDVPAAADVGVRLHLGRLVLGHRRRPLQGRLPLQPFRRPLLRPPTPRLRRPSAAAMPRAGGFRRRQGRAEPAAGGGHAVGAAKPHGVQLLLRPQEEPRPHARMPSSCSCCSYLMMLLNKPQ